MALTGQKMKIQAVILSFSLAASTSFFMGNVVHAQNSRTTSDTISFLKNSLETVSNQPANTNEIPRTSSPSGRQKKLKSDAFSSSSVVGNKSAKYYPVLKLPTRAELAQKQMAAAGSADSSQIAQYPELQRRNFSMPAQAPTLSAASKEELSGLADKFCMQQGILRPSANQPSLYDRVGAPPFPLCLLPEKYWKDVLQKTAARKNIASQNISGPSSIPGVLSNLQFKRGTVKMHTSSSSFISTAQINRVSAEEKGSLKKKSNTRQMKHTSLSESYFTCAGQSAVGKTRALTYPTYYSSVQFPN